MEEQLEIANGQLEDIRDKFQAPPELVRVVNAAYKALGSNAYSLELLRRILLLAGEVEDFSFYMKDLEEIGEDTAPAQAAESIVKTAGAIVLQEIENEFDTSELYELLRVIRGEE